MKETHLREPKPYPRYENIGIQCRLKTHNIDQEKLAALAQNVLDMLSISEFEFSISLVNARAIRTLNRKYRDKDEATDVLAFPQVSWPMPLKALPTAATIKQTATHASQPKTLGDVIICISQAQKNADQLGHTLDREVCFLLVHGILHLCGHDHQTKVEENEMNDNQKTIMNALRDWGPKPHWSKTVTKEKPKL